MSEGKFKAVVLDLFDTIVRWDPQRLPLLQWGGREVRSTVPWFLPRLKEVLQDRHDHQAALAVYFDVLQELSDERERDAIEISCHERFVRMLTRLGYDGEPGIGELAAELTSLHMAGVRRVTWAPPERIEAVKEIAPHYRLGILSNFDDSETGHLIVRDTGVAGLFEAIIISADLGLRKPNPLIFKRMTEMLKLEPGEILFVGDTPRFDITGPHRAGMGTVWLNDGKQPLTPDIPKPGFTIKDLTELPGLLRDLG